MVGLDVLLWFSEIQEDSSSLDSKTTSQMCITFLSWGSHVLYPILPFFTSYPRKVSLRRKVLWSWFTTFQCCLRASFANTYSQNPADMHLSINTAVLIASPKKPWRRLAVDNIRLTLSWCVLPYLLAKLLEEGLCGAFTSLSSLVKSSKFNYLYICILLVWGVTEAWKNLNAANASIFTFQQINPNCPWTILMKEPNSPWTIQSAPPNI